MNQKTIVSKQIPRPFANFSINYSKQVTRTKEEPRIYLKRSHVDRGSEELNICKERREREEREIHVNAAIY